MKVLIADDSAVMRAILVEVFQQQVGFTVIGEAKNGQDVIEKNQLLCPDIIIMDIKMPILSGLDAIPFIMQTRPVPILILSTEVDTQISIKAKKLGAASSLKKPSFDQLNDPQFISDFIRTVCSLQKRVVNRPSHNKNYEVVVLGASTGGPVAIMSILSKLPADFPLPIIIVQHLEESFDTNYVEWLNSESILPVHLAKEKETPKPGQVIVSPANHHLVFVGRQLHLDNGPRVLNQKPAIDLLFKSAAQEFQEQVIGILLTGMGTDGAVGCVSIKQSGGYTIIQDKESSAVFGMPKAAIEGKGDSIVLPLNEIPSHLNLLARGH